MDRRDFNTKTVTTAPQTAMGYLINAFVGAVKAIPGALCYVGQDRNLSRRDFLTLKHRPVTDKPTI